MSGPSGSTPSDSTGAAPSPGQDPSSAARITLPRADRPDGPDGPDWTDQVTDLIVDTVATIRSRTTGPILQGAKGVVHGVVALIVLVPVTILVLAGSVRVLNYLLPGDVWLAYAVMSAVFLLVGGVLWRQRGRGSSRH
jgi:hypothetical protein